MLANIGSIGEVNAPKLQKAYNAGSKLAAGACDVQVERVEHEGILCMEVAHKDSYFTAFAMCNPIHALVDNN